jgi:hypothetical protein
MIKTEVSKEGVTTQTAIGEVSYDDIMSAIDRQINHPNFVRNGGALWDFRKRDLLNLSVKDICDIIDGVNEISDQIGPEFKVALIASNKTEWAITKIYEAIGIKCLSHETRVFKGMEWAKKWVNGLS